MGAIEKLNPGSFRGRSFLVNSERREGGKKFVSHEYPNSNKRFTEELGEAPPKFTLEAIIHGDDVINQRLLLENALNEEGLGTLVHPVYGTLQVKSTTFSVSTNQTAIGEARFSINFETSEPVVTASPVATDSFTVSSSRDEAAAALNTALGAEYQEPTLADSLNSSADKVLEITESVEAQIANVVTPVQSGVSAFARVANEIERQVFSVVQDDSILESSIGGLYDAFLSIASTPSDLLAAWEALTTFGALDRYKTDTFERRQIANNANILNEHTRLMALAGAYESVSYVEFTTDSELNSLQSFLDDTYDSLLRDSITDVSVSDTSVLALDRGVRDTFAKLRNDTRKTLDALKENLWRVVDIDPGFSSMALTSYRYYGNLDNLELLASLNPGSNVSGFSGAIKAVTK